MAHLPKPRPDHIDRGPKMSLEEAADRCKVDVNWLRNLVGRSPITPVLTALRPTRRYYSLLKIKELVRLSDRGAPH